MVNEVSYYTIHYFNGRIWKAVVIRGSWHDAVNEAFNFKVKGYATKIKRGKQ
jgi:hypothetical protein